MKQMETAEDLKLKIVLAISSTSFNLSALVREAPASAPTHPATHPMRCMSRLHKQKIGIWAYHYTIRTREQFI